MNIPSDEQWDDAIEVKKLRAELAGLRKQLRYEVTRVDQWRRRYGALQTRLRELEKASRP